MFRLIGQISLETGREHVLDDYPAERSGAIRGTDNRKRLWIDRMMKVANAHDLQSSLIEDIAAFRRRVDRAQSSGKEYYVQLYDLNSHTSIQQFSEPQCQVSGGVGLLQPTSCSPAGCTRLGIA